jgi:hypothetical protein
MSLVLSLSTTVLPLLAFHSFIVDFNLLDEDRVWVQGSTMHSNSLARYR